MRVISYKHHSTKLGYDDTSKTFYFFMKILSQPTRFDAPTRNEAIKKFREVVDYFLNVVN